MKMLKKQLMLIALLASAQAVLAMEDDQDAAEMSENVRNIRESKSRLVAPTRELSDPMEKLHASEAKVLASEGEALMKMPGVFRWRLGYDYLVRVKTSPVLAHYRSYKLSRNEIAGIKNAVHNVYDQITMIPKGTIPEAAYDNMHNIYMAILERLDEMRGK